MAKGDKLTLKQEKFCQVYVETGNASEAYRRAYQKSQKWKESSLNVQAAKSLEIPKVKARVGELRARQAKRHDLKADDVTRGFARIAFSDLRKLFNEDGKLKPPHELNEDIAAAVASFEVTSRKSGDDGEIEYVSKIKFWSKPNALEALAKHLGLFEKDNQQKAEGSHENNVKLPPAVEDLLTRITERKND